MRKRIAFFGIGTMGTPMVRNLMKAGHEVVTAYYPNTPSIEILEKEGLNVAGSNAEAAAGADIVITMLPEDKDIESVLLHPDLINAIQPESVVMDMSSSRADTAMKLSEAYGARGVYTVDAAVSGGQTGAVNGTLAIFTAGDQAVIEERAMPALTALGDKIHYVGRIGSAKTFKNLNQMLCCVNMAGVSEVFWLAEKSGIDLQKFYDVVMESTGRSFSFSSGFKAMMAGNVSGGFRQSLARKDLKNALALADGQPVPVAETVYQMMLLNREFDSMGMSSLYKLYDVH